MLENLKEIIRSLKDLRDEISLIKCSDDMIFDVASRIFISQNIQENKQQNIKDFKEAKINVMEKSKEQEFIPASEKQKALLRKAEYNQDVEKLSKQEASNLIKKYIEESNKRRKGEEY